MSSALNSARKLCFQLSEYGFWYPMCERLLQKDPPHNKKEFKYSLALLIVLVIAICGASISVQPPSTWAAYNQTDSGALWQNVEPDFCWRQINLDNIHLLEGLGNHAGVPGAFKGIF